MPPRAALAAALLVLAAPAWPQSPPSACLTLEACTAEGDVAIREDGRPVDPESPAACTKGQ